MKKLNQILTLAALIALLFVGCLNDDEGLESVATGDSQAQQIAETDEEVPVISYSSQVIPGQYIVVYKEGVLSAGRSMETKTYQERQSIMHQEAVSTLKKSAVKTDKVKFVYGTALKGFSLVDATEEEIAALRKNDQVEYIEQDQTISVSMGGPPGGGGGGGGGGQTTPYGITRVNGVSNYTGSGKAWIIDSGIDLDHPDLNVDVANSANYASGNSPNDGNGHGTHVAGTVAAINNSTGVIGVAPGASVVAVRVLGNSGSGSTSGVIAGVNYVGANASSSDVANMSLGGGVSTALDNAVINASGSSGCNCPFTLAAGNESDDANSHSPARANGPNIYTISGSDINDNWYNRSNYGNPPVDWCAPGVAVTSTYKGGGYATFTGTSMAAPHVCGILLLGNITQSGTVNGDPDGNPDKIASH